MADTWEAAVDVGAVTHTGPTTGLNTLSTGTAFYAFVSRDRAVGASYPTILVFRAIHGTGVYFTREMHGFSSNGDWRTTFVPTSTHDGAAGGTEFVDGGTLSIVKNEPGTQYEFTGLVGTSTVPFSTFGGVPDGELAPDRVDNENSAVTDAGATVHASTLTVPWSNFFGRKNGNDIKGATLGTGDRGSWVASGSAHDPWFLSNNATGSFANADTGAAIALAITGAVGPPPGTGRAFRRWDQSVYLDGGAVQSLDMDRAPEHGALFAAYVYTDDVETLLHRRSFDIGGNWEETTIYSDGGTSNSSPSIVWNGGKLYAVWHNGTDILQSLSRDMGTTWGGAVTLAISGTNPRLLARPDGLSFYFFVDGTDLLLLRSGDFGSSFLDGSAISVAVGVGAQTVAAEMGPDGTLIVGFIVAGAWTQVRSRDLGLTWA